MKNFGSKFNTVLFSIIILLLCFSIWTVNKTRNSTNSDQATETPNGFTQTNLNPNGPDYQPDNSQNFNWKILSAKDSGIGLQVQYPDTLQVAPLYGTNTANVTGITLTPFNKVPNGELIQNWSDIDSIVVSDEFSCKDATNSSADKVFCIQKNNDGIWSGTYLTPENQNMIQGNITVSLYSKNSETIKTFDDIIFKNTH